MAFDRQTILRSPGAISYDGATILSEGPITVDLITEYFDVMTSAYGRLGRRIKDRWIDINLVPKLWDSQVKLYPYASKFPGDRIFGAVDKPLVITPRNGAPLTIANAMPTKLSGLTLSATKSIMRAMTFTGIVANNADPALAASYFSFGVAAANVALGSATLAKIPNAVYSAVYNAVTYKSLAGFEIDFNLSLDPFTPDGSPRTDFIITELEASLRFTPVGMTEDAFATLLGWGVGIGAAPFAGDVVITGAGGGPVITLANAQVQTAKANYDTASDRIGELQFASVRKEAAGALGALWIFA